MNKIKDFLFHSAIILIAIPTSCLIVAFPISLAICVLKECIYDYILFNDSEWTFEIYNFNLMLVRLLYTTVSIGYLLLITKYNKQFRQWLLNF